MSEFKKKAFSMQRGIRPGAKIEPKSVFPGHPPLTEKALKDLRDAQEGKMVQVQKKRTVCAICGHPDCDYPERRPA